MRGQWHIFLLGTLACLMFQGFFSMMEMACVSFNKVRLQYYVTQNKWRAVLLTKLLQNPTRLFGVTLIGVNGFLQLGSEFSRQFYLSLGMDPNYAPLTEIVLVLMFGELIPLFAGRRFPEHMAFIGVPVIYAFSWILRPIILFFDALCYVVNRLLKSPKRGNLYVSRDELLHALEEHVESSVAQEEEDMSSAISNIFALKEKTAKEFMSPISLLQPVSKASNVRFVRSQLRRRYTPFVAVYDTSISNIQGIVYTRDLLRLDDSASLQPHIKNPWFIDSNLSIFQILKLFRKNNKSVGFVIDESADLIGYLTLDSIMDNILGTTEEWDALTDVEPKFHDIVISRVFVGEKLVSEINAKYGIHLDCDDGETVEERLERAHGHILTKDVKERIDNYELICESISPPRIRVRTLH